MMSLYRADVRQGAGPGIDELVSEWREEHGFELPPYSREVVEGVTAQREAIDEELGAFLAEWSVERLGAVERAILRIAMWELSQETVPGEVVLDEAVELAKRYASPEAARLVNGVLASCFRARTGADLADDDSGEEEQV